MIEGPIAILLAAGHGKRMKSDKAKVLHEICGRPMIRYVIDAVRGAGAKTIIVVVGYGAEQLRAELADDPLILFATQTKQLGTGDAVKACRPLLEGYTGTALVLVGDMPLVRPEPLKGLLDRRESDQSACLLGTAEVPDPKGFGRILRDSAGRFLKIVEERDCSLEERAIKEINPSCYVFQPGLWDALDQLDTGNAQGEYYLTDAPQLLQAMGRKVKAIRVLEADDILGINTRHHLAQATAIMRSRIIEHLLQDGVTVVDPQNTYIDGRAVIGQDTVIYPFTVISGKVKVGRDCRIGPFSHLRDGTILGDEVEIGAFVEVSRSKLENNVMARHLAYLGDAHVGEGANIGAAAVTANFDGVEKGYTEIGAGAFVGSGSVLIAPVTVGKQSIVGAGSVVTKNHDVADGQTVFGVPARPQTHRPA